MCSFCDDTGWKHVTTNGVDRVVRCECWLRKGATQRIRAANIPKRYHHCGFDNFNAYNESLQRALAYGRRVVEEFPLDRGLLLIGLPGVGKTHLAVATLKAWIEKGGTGLFYTMIDLLSLLRGTYASQEGRSESDVLERVKQADMLVLDELGRERVTEWRDEMLHLIVNARYSDRRVTIFTTNFDINDDPIEGFPARVGLRIYSRLHEMCEFLHVDGADYRARPTNWNTDDLITMWKMRANEKKTLPLRAKGPLRAQLKQTGPAKELGWSGGKAST
jgi:DNA replication protein DnaC